MDLLKFREKLKEYRNRIGISQEELADGIRLHKSMLSGALNGKRPISTDLVHRIILYLAEQQAIRGQSQAFELITLTDSEDFSEADWKAPPLADLSPEPPAPAPPEQFLLQATLPFDTFDESMARTKYLERVIYRYGSLTLPTGARQELSLRKAFQPLQLRKEIITVEDLPYEDRRAFLDELSGDDDSLLRTETAYGESLGDESEWSKMSPVIAANGDEALAKNAHGRMVLLGSPGTGKTTLLRHFIVEIAHKAVANLTDLLPIYMSLSDFANSGKTLQEYLPTILGMLGVDNRYAHALWRAIEQGKAFLCLDALEQVAPDPRRNIVAWINTQASEPGNVWIICSRFNEYNGGQFTKQFIEWESHPMTHQLRQKLAQILIPELHQQIPKPNALPPTPSAFVNAIESHPQAVNWGANPLLFSLAAVAFVRTGALPSSRAALYQEIITAVIATHLGNKNTQTLLRTVMAPLALQLYQQKKRVLSREMLLQYLAKIRRSQEETWQTEEISQALLDTGILEVVAKDTYGFWHQTFAEYFAGVELVV